MSDSLKVFERFANCLNCNLHFKFKAEHPSFEAEKKRYNEHNNSTQDEGYLNYLARLLDHIPELEEPILDFGCGPTKGLEALFKREAIDKSLISYDPIFFNTNLEQKKFKTIYASECFEHFNEPKKSIKKVLGLMSSESTLAIRTELYSAEIGDLDKWWYFKDPTHLCFYTEDTMKWISKEYKLEILSMKSPFIIFKSSF